ncbi:hypothetical protein B0T26DRAFT_721227 [Lasiosphaeria miniovina]|uniref:Uncharacterized protein n=1 Tax=Lasiosphaeria miniovina TaxID=1954250 RepID=A0AA40DRI7_9PEZI|nr:uncharacterized protein B0T26DRAFT_721227 [Lasiosphaeria miniovina]KAK0709338.1 hypothetical protein B0T26DRAFT_721227 [Lasiosphaeria miniovina]
MKGRPGRRVSKRALTPPHVSIRPRTGLGSTPDPHTIEPAGYMAIVMSWECPSMPGPSRP